MNDRDRLDELAAGSMATFAALIALSNVLTKTKRAEVLQAFGQVKEQLIAHALNDGTPDQFVHRLQDAFDQ